MGIESDCLTYVQDRQTHLRGQACEESKPLRALEVAAKPWVSSC